MVSSSGQMSLQEDKNATTPQCVYAVSSEPQGSIYDRRTRKYQNVLLSVTMFILFMELAERLSYYGINQGLKNFMTDKLGWGQVAANSLKSTWTSLCYLSPLLGAWLADEKFGRFKVILAFGVWYLVGDFLVAAAAHPTVLEDKTLANIIFSVGLFLGIGVGTGAIKSNVVTFGADQFNPEDPRESEQKEKFFSTFYWCINLGAGVSYGYLTILAVNGSPQIPKEYGYFAVFLICAFVMLVALGILLAGHSRYVHLPKSESALSKLCKTMIQNTQYSLGAKAIVGGVALFLLSFVLTTVAAFTVGSSDDTAHLTLTVLGGGCTFIGMFLWIAAGMNPSYMNRSKVENGGTLHGQTVDEVKQVIRVLPFASFLVMWHCAYDQVDANFQSVTQQCDLRITASGTQIPGALLGVFGPISIIIVIPLLDHVIYPFWSRLFGKKPSPYGKVLAGLILAVVGMIWTGIFEIIRRHSPGIYTTDAAGVKIPLVADGGKQPMNEMPWFAAIPQYIFIGTAECLVNVTAFDIFYSNVPEYLKSTCQAINLFMIAMGANATAFFTLAFQSFIPNNLNEGKLEYMYFAVAAVSTANIALYVWCMRTMQFGMSSSSLTTPKASEAMDAVGRKSTSILAVEEPVSLA